MNSNKSRPAQKRGALAPQRRHGKLRVAALLEAGALVIAEKGFQAATMAEIASKAGAPVGSLYRFFPNKEILADALIQRFGELISEAFEKINGTIKSMSTAALAESLLNMLVDLHGEKLAIELCWKRIRIGQRNAKNFEEPCAGTSRRRSPCGAPSLVPPSPGIWPSSFCR